MRNAFFIHGDVVVAVDAADAAAAGVVRAVIIIGYYCLKDYTYFFILKIQVTPNTIQKNPSLMFLKW